MSSTTPYITTPIYYVNDRPHIGHVYTTTLCDVYARAMRQRECGAFFLTGTDEHGVKVEQSAINQGITPQELADKNSAEFQSMLDKFSITNDKFIRTTDPYHIRQVQKFVSTLLESGDIYLGTFEGWYDEGQEEYHTETSARELDYVSPVSGRPLSRAKEQNYYFKLSKYQPILEELFSSEAYFVRPESRRNEMLGRLKEGLQDVPISRTNFSWGIPMPNDNEHVIYVWIDALFNYITALGLGEDDSKTNKLWPATYHVVGKEILWFHAIVWPAILLALDLPLPKCIYAHSFWISEGRKMSKTLGNFIDMEKIDFYVSRYGEDAWRYYLITQGPLGSTDADFVYEKFHDIYNAHLVNTVGNCASRITAMIEKYCDGLVPPASSSEIRNQEADAIYIFDWSSRSQDYFHRYNKAIDSFALDKAADAAMELVRDIDLFINNTAPFKLAKDTSKRDILDSILYECAEAIKLVSIMLEPVMPAKMRELQMAFSTGTRVKKIALFPRLEKEE